MVENIAIVGLDRKVAYKIAKSLAKELDMHFFDALELFEFDHIPRTLSTLLKDYGISYYKKKEKSIVGYASEFTNCVINFEGSIADSESNIKTIKETCLMIYLREKTTLVKRRISSRKYNSIEEKNFYNVNIETLNTSDNILNSASNIVITMDKEVKKDVVSYILEEINNFYLKK